MLPGAEEDTAVVEAGVVEGFEGKFAARAVSVWVKVSNCFVTFTTFCSRRMRRCSIAKGG